jgi:hypothetical protein
LNATLALVFVVFESHSGPPDTPSTLTNKFDNGESLQDTANQFANDESWRALDARRQPPPETP